MDVVDNGRRIHKVVLGLSQMLHLFPRSLIMCNEDNDSIATEEQTIILADSYNNKNHTGITGAGQLNTGGRTINLNYEC